MNEYDLTECAHWLERATTIKGTARHMGDGNSAIISASLDLTVLDIVDDAGNSAPARICSAAGFDSGAPVAAGLRGNARVVSSRPTRQRR